MQTEKLILPIDEYIPGILEATRNYSTVLVKASPGSGKTTRLPWSIAKSLNKKVAVLEPRRLAAKLAATRIADEQKLVLGEEVGYHFRFEKNLSKDTQLTFYTEGTFLKKFLSDKELSDIDVVILDEFHERHIETDLALALLRTLQERRDLKIILMSATLDSKLRDSFPDSKLFEIDAHMYPVEVTYLPNQPSILNQPLEVKIKNAIEGLRDKNILVFVPGMREMLRVKSYLGDENVRLLHADLSREEQQEALSITSGGKIILATNIAESSVTIPGVSVVIDSGIQREAHYSAWNGLKLIHDIPITKSSAIQRAGRAGRTGPGICKRLYAQQDFNERSDHTIAEINKADLTDIYLLVKGSATTPKWFENPPAEKWNKAHDLLSKLGAIQNDELTATGKMMLQYPLDSRLSRILLQGEKLDLENKTKLLRYICEEIEEDRTGSLKRRLNFYLKTAGKEPGWEKCILSGFIDQIARYRIKQRDFIHYSGKTIKVHPSLDLHDEYYLILDITQRQEAIKVFPVDEEWLWDIDPFPFSEEDEIQVADKVTIRKKTKLGSIVIEEGPVKVSWEGLHKELKEKISILTANPFASRLSAWKENPEFERLVFWNKEIETFVDNLRSSDFFDDYQDMSWEHFEIFIRSRIQEEFDFSNLERELPLKINLGGRRELTIHYPRGMDPYLEAPIQDFYGINDTPSIMNGKIPLTLKLLGPHKRPIQITKDLKNFWQKTYLEMKKEYQRDYPRHHWPDKPWEARPVLLKSHLKT